LESAMQPGNRSTFRHEQDSTGTTDPHHASETFRNNRSDAAVETMARGSKDKPVKVDRDSDFLAGAADGDNPTPDYDDALDTLADFLVNGWHEYYGEERRAFDVGDDGSISVQISGLSKAGQKLALHALDVWTAATGIDFKVVKTGAEIVINDDFASAYTNTEVDGNTITSASINISDEWLANNGTGIYDYSMLTFIHEMGHALGLGHAGVYDFAGNPVYPDPPFANDSWQASIMSYFSQEENDNIDADYAIPVTPMMADLLAIRKLYGAEELRTGNNIYSFKADLKAGASLTVVDDGGIDRLDFSWSKKANVVDLHEEAFSSINGLKGNLAIARGTIVEAAVGGTKSDTIIGSDYANALYGNLGADTLTGNDGEDFFVFDTAPSAGNADTITDFTAGVDSLVFNNAIFTKLGKDGALGVNAFAANDMGAAADRSDRVIYDTVTGEVFYDADGSKSGKAVLVAEIGAGLALTAGDVLVI
jgi:serralysin